MSASIRFASPRLAAALIDLDGTMIDTVDDFTAALNAMLARIGAPGTQRDEVMHYVGKGSENLIVQVLKPRLAEAEAQARFDEALAIYQAEYATINGRHTRLYPTSRPAWPRCARPAWRWPASPTSRIASR